MDEQKKATSAVTARLFELRDEAYAAFQQKLMPTVPADRVIGVRTPAARVLAKELAGSDLAEAFLADLPHRYYDENQLHTFLISLEKDFDRAVALTDAFLPYVDNWATCDQLAPRVFAKRKAELLPQIDRWLASGKTYTVRFGIEMLMNHFLDDAFLPEHAARVAAVRSEEYYVRMMIAWYFATALAKQYDAVLPYLTGNSLDTWTHNKTIQKAIESNCISAETKTYLRGLKRKD